MSDTKDQGTRDMGNTFVREHPWTARRNLLPAFNGAAREAINNEIQIDMARKLDLFNGRLSIAKALPPPTNNPHIIASTARTQIMLLSRDQETLEDILWEIGRMAERNELQPEVFDNVKGHLGERLEFIKQFMQKHELMFQCHYLWVHFVVLECLKTRFFV